MLPRSFFTLSLVVALAGVASAASPQDVAPPANAPASVQWNAAEATVALRYHGTVILDATIGAEDAKGNEVKGVAVTFEPAETLGDKVEQRLEFVPAKLHRGVTLVLRGTVTGSEEAFPAETLSEIDRPFDHWSVLARFNWRQKELGWKRAGAPEEEIKFADLGLHGDHEYLVFEFWTQTYLGKSKGSFTAPAQDPNNGLQIFAIREARPHPWVLSTTRHISQGGVSLLDERWDDGRNVLSGRSAVVVGDPYVLTVHLPDGFRLKDAEIGGEQVELANQKRTATVRMVPSATKTVERKMTFVK